MRAHSRLNTPQWVSAAESMPNAQGGARLNHNCGEMRAKGSKLERRRQAFLYPELGRHIGGLAPHFVGLIGFGLWARARVVTAALAADSGVERFTGARALVLVAEVGKTHLSHIRKVVRKAIRAIRDRTVRRIFPSTMERIGCAF